MPVVDRIALAAAKKNSTIGFSKMMHRLGGARVRSSVVGLEGWPLRDVSNAARDSKVLWLPAIMASLAWVVRCDFTFREVFRSPVWQKSRLQLVAKSRLQLVAVTGSQTMAARLHENQFEGSDAGSY